MDERFDPEKSTRAYARYMKFLYDQLGDWYLAMAAYDHGAGNIQREVSKTGLCAISGSSTSATNCPGDRELCAGNSRRHHHRQQSQAVRL